MRCPKCGYTSFDHLTDCNKCGKNLGDSRATLNLQDFEPQVPFLLGSLVGGEMQGGGGGQQQELSLTQETELELGGFETSEEDGLDATVDIGSVGGGLEADSDDDLKLSEIDLGDLGELSSEGSDAAEEDEGFLGLELDEDEAPADDLGAFDEGLTEGPAVAPSEDDLELDLSEQDLSELAKELEGHLEEEAGGKKQATGDESLPELDEVILEMEDE